MRPQQCASACTITSTVMLLRTCSQKCPSGFYIYHPQHSERYCNANNYRWLSYNLPDNLPDEASPWGGGDWLGLWSQIDYSSNSSLWNDSSLCTFSRWRLKQVNGGFKSSESLHAVLQMVEITQVFPPFCHLSRLLDQQQLKRFLLNCC